MDSELLTCLLKFIEYFPDYLSALSRTLLRFFWTTFVETAVYKACQMIVIASATNVVFNSPIQGNPKDYVVVGWDTEKGQQIEAIAIKKLAVDGHPSTGATVRMQYQGQIWKGQILSFHGRMFTLLC